MSLEIERRFIVKGDNWKEFIQNSQELKQGYLANSKKEWTIRVRIVDKKQSLLTLKHPKEGIIRHEFEYIIPISDGLSIFEMSNFSLSKTRHELFFNHQKWIIDCFKFNNYPLVIAEIELNRINQSIEIPSWCSSEVSHLKEFSNAMLAKSPISTWPIGKKHLIL
tara:strand:- start:137 stop:631 length:495 start_codon:yes stop_codon:yes gene_type:complete